METTYSITRWICVLFTLLLAAFTLLAQEACAGGIDPNIEWVRRTITTSSNQIRAIYVADINGDGFDDVVIVRGDYFTFSEVAWYKNEGGHPLSWTEYIIASLPGGCCMSDVFAADIDDDQDIDVISAAFIGGTCGKELVWYENDGAPQPSWTEHVIAQSKSLPSGSKGYGASISAIDINGDDFVDIAWSSSGYVAWYENDGSSPPSWTEHLIPSTLFLGPGTCIYAADLNGDQDVDVIVGTIGSDARLAWYENSGGLNPTWIERDIDINWTHDVVAIDIDGDEDVDVVTDNIYWYENGGGSVPSWTQHTVGSGENTVYVVDVDNDGDIDVVGHRYNAGNPCWYWYENDGASPPTWTEHHIDCYYSRILEVGFVSAADFDNDRDIDVVGGYTSKDDLLWFENPFYYPEITSISDVGNDQGRQVRVTWKRCYYDDSGSPVTITEYGLWRRIGEDKGGDFADESFPLTKQWLDTGRPYPPGDWDFIKTVPARGESTYSSVCPTLGDYTEAEGIYWSVFFVSAMTSDPLAYFDSQPDSGYSIDNIPPLPIQDLDIDPNSWFTLEWTVPGEYEGEEPISGYDIRYSTVPVDTDTEAWWDDAVTCTGDEFFGFVVGEMDSLQAAEEAWHHPQVYFAVKGLDERPNVSGISNIVHFVCGDANANDMVEAGDIVYLITYLFRNGPAPEPMAIGDANCNELVEAGDVVHLISYLFRNGPPPCG